MKQLAILDYLIMFDPSEAWSSGSQFEGQLSDFFAAFGYEAQVVEPKGNSGKRIIYLTKLEVIPMPTQKPDIDMTKQVKKVQQQVPSKSFKQFSQRGIPYNLMREKKVPDLSFKVPGQTNRMKVRA